MTPREGDSVTWTTASIRAAVIVLYFVITTVWLPDFLLALDFVKGSSDFVSDLVTSVVWGAALVGGMWALRIAQRRGMI